MEQEDFIKMWRKFLVDIGKTQAEVAEATGQSRQNFGQKINNGTIRFLDIQNIAEKYGYTLEFRKNESGGNK